MAGTSQDKLSYWMKKTGGNKNAAYTLYKRNMQSKRRGVTGPTKAGKAPVRTPVTSPSGATASAVPFRGAAGARGMTNFQAAGKQIHSGPKHAAALLGGLAAPLAVPLVAAAASAPAIAAATGTAAALAAKTVSAARGLTPSARAAKAAKAARSASAKKGVATKKAKKQTKVDDAAQKGETAAATYHAGALSHQSRSMR